MVKLKTLKDITSLNVHNPMGLSDLIRNELRNAAREWLREYEKIRKRNSNKKILKSDDCEYLDFASEKETYLIINEEVVEWIKYFFNLEDEK